MKELELREKELERQKEKDEEEKKRKESLAGQTRFYGDALKHSLPKMGNDPTEFPAYFRAIENLFTLFEVPSNLRFKLLLPMLNERSKTLLAKLSKEQLDDYKRVKAYLLREFKLTAEQYRDKFWSAAKLPEETYTLFGGRVKNLFMYYMDSRQVASRDDLVDLLVADRIKQTLSDACLRHVLSAEGEGWFHPEKLTSVIDTYVNSRLNMSVQRDKSDFAKRPVPKSFGAGTGLQETGGVNKSFYTPGPTKSTPLLEKTNFLGVPSIATSLDISQRTVGLKRV